MHLSAAESWSKEFVVWIWMKKKMKVESQLSFDAAWHNAQEADTVMEHVEHSEMTLILAAKHEEIWIESETTHIDMDELWLFYVLYINTEWSVYDWMCLKPSVTSIVVIQQLCCLLVVV